MYSLLSTLKPLLRLLSVVLLIAGIGGLLLGLGPKFYGHVGDPDGDFIKIAASGVACLVAALALNRVVKCVKDDPRDHEGHGFPVQMDDKTPDEG